MTFNPITSPVDHVILQGQESPGICVIEGAGSPRQWDERRGYGISGATSIYKGAKLVHFSLKFTLWTAEHFAEWATFSQLLMRPPTGTRPTVMAISHPILEDLGVIHVAVEDLLQPVQDDTGGWVYEAKMIQYRRPRPALARPDGSEGGPEVDDAGDRAIANRTATVESLGAELNAP